jgi:glutathione S-transferase
LYGAAEFDRGGKARWLLNEMGVAYQDHWLDIKNKENKGAAYRKLHPMGRVPVAQIDDQVMFESGAICAYLADLYLEKGMAPALDAPERARYQQWMYFASATIDSIQFRNDLTETMSDGVPNQTIKTLQDELRDALRAIDQVLAKNSFLVGNRFSTADICVSYQLYWLRFSPALKPVMDSFPQVQAYIDKMFARPAAKTAKWPRPTI